MSDPINDFLIKAKTGATSHGLTTVVLGNEAADLDSMASSIAYAFLLSRDESVANPVPVMNIPRNDFKLRTEAVYLFGDARIAVDALTFIDEIDLEALARKDNLRLVLIDHNRISTCQEAYSNSVVEIIDHHTDEGTYPPTARVDIQAVGSTATLIANRYISGGGGLPEGAVGTLLLGTILLDTVNLDPQAERVTDEDAMFANQLLKKTVRDRKGFFDRLQFEKFNVSSLESYDLLRKDYKEWQTGDYKYGIGSVLLPASDWLKKDPGIFMAFGRYLEERGLDVLIAMNAFRNPGFERNLCVYAGEANRKSQLCEFLEGSDLGLEKINLSSIDDNERAAFYYQKNLGISRKKLQPILDSYFATDPEDRLQ